MPRSELTINSSIRNFSQSPTAKRSKKSVATLAVPQPATSKILAYLSGLHVSDVIQRRPEKSLPLKTICASDTLASAIENISTWGSSLAPVQDDKGNYIGILDIIDLVYICYSKFKKTDWLESSYDIREEFSTRTVQEILDLSGKNKWTSISYDAPFLDLIEVLSRPEIKRIAVMKEDKDVGSNKKEVEAILTHSSILEFLLASEQFKDLLKQPVMRSGIIQSTKANGKTTSEAMEDLRDDFNISCTFKTIWQKQSSGGVVSHGICFLDKFLNWMVQIMLADLPVEEITISKTGSLEDLLKILVKQNVHRVFIVEETNSQKVPIGCVQPHDILLKFVEKENFPPSSPLGRRLADARTRLSVREM